MATIKDLEGAVPRPPQPVTLAEMDEAITAAVDSAASLRPDWSATSLDAMTEAQVGAYDAKTHLPRLLDRVERGAIVTITRHGREVARLVPVDPRPDPAAVIAALRDARAGVRLDGDTVREMIDEGRR